MTFRPALRPGAALMRRDATHLQIGLAPATIVRDRPGLMAALRLLDGVRDVPRLVAVARTSIPELTLDFAQEIDRLHANGTVIDASAMAVAERQRKTRRSQLSVGIVHDSSTQQLAGEINSALTVAGFQRNDHEPEVSVILSLGEPSRSVFEAALSRHQAHLPVAIDESRIRIGPFVIPGISPCVTCADDHRTDFDPAWPALALQFGRRSSITTPPTVDPLTARSGAVAVASEVAALADDQRPRTAGSVLTLGPAPVQIHEESFTAHPRCTCSIFVGATPARLS